jgi:hypothetical protein
MLTRVQAFEKLRANLQLTGLQEQTVATRQRNVRSAVERQLTVTDDFLTGSYRRQTLISPLKHADVDVVVVLDRSYRDRGPRAVLELVRKALLAEYPRTPEISRNGQAVTITFSDFIIDVVPAFALPWWSWTDGWEICDSGSNSWITTDPKKHVKLSAAANRVHDGNLVPCIKQLKAWNRTVGKPLRSFHLEVVAWSVFGRSWFWYENMKSDWDSARYFFAKASDKLRHKISDPAGTELDVGAYLTGTAREQAISKMSTAHQRCVRADTAAKEDNLAAMHAEYSKVFGGYYRF